MTAQLKGQSVLEGIINSILTAGTVTKPIAVVLQSYGTTQGMSMLYNIRRKFIEAGIPTYPSFAQAANAISNFVRYHSHC